MKSAFGSCHPLVIFIWFAAAITLSVVLMNPLCLTFSLVCSAATLAKLAGARTLGKTLAFLVPVLAAAAAVNCLFNHAGVTPLAYFPSGNALTAEALAYGAAAAVMAASAIMWCGCLNRVMTSDKLTCLFGRALPSLGVLVSMTLRFVPRFSSHLRETAEAQRQAGLEKAGAGRLAALRRALRVFSITATWALESSVQTADSMKSRGWGLSGRTSFTPTRFDGRDAALLAATAALTAAVAAGMAAGRLYWHYFPYIGGTVSYALSCAYLMLCALPLFTELLEDAKWKRLESTT